MRDELDLRLVDVAAFHASQGPMLKAGTRRDNALNCRTGLASRTARTLGGERRRVLIGHGIDPGKVKFRRNSGAGGSPLPLLMSLDDGHATGYQLALSGRGPHMSDVVDIIAARVAAVVASDFRFAYSALPPLPCGCCASTRSSLTASR